MIICCENRYMVKKCFSQIASKSKNSRCEEKLTGAVLFCSGQSLGKKVPCAVVKQLGRLGICMIIYCKIYIYWGYLYIVCKSTA